MEHSEELQRYRYLASKWLDHTITEDELKEFNNWYTANLDAPLNIPGSFAATESVLEARILKKLNDKFGVVAESNRHKLHGGAKISWLVRIAVAASILIAMAAGLWFYQNRTIEAQLQIVTQTDIPPGKNTAMLTFSNGTVVQLSDARKAVFINQEKLKYNDGTVVGMGTEAKGIAASELITAATPKGGTYQVILSDGTHVWLNADSKLSFPSQFTGNSRTVTLSGEAYFEVAKNKAKPFVVNYGKSAVEVLGTHFNIMAYKDEAASKVTLLEGAVKVNSGAEKVVLKPGQQAEILEEKGAAIALNNDIDTEQVIAWKNGYFMFANEPVESIMRKISRWYDVTVVYEDNQQDKALWGTVSRFKNVSEVLRRLELTGVVRFKMENLNGKGKERRIIVMK
ncbi:FecR family protein [Pedobacter sp. ok626]|uniref:FecR family protein n=1 Tax=Pedobacter sp. ok626 TaxID=1761882 RepID=UPI00088BA178|nr:FecR family protein [Pedobacter sp. ok626]SDK66553.1 FecR family protein [Pedobacter sp. ok626]